MPITTRFLKHAANQHVVVPAWTTIGDWLEMLAARPLATPLVDFGQQHWMHVGVTSLNWYLMDLLSLRQRWFVDGWCSREQLWLLINPLRYLILGHQPYRPYAHDVRDYLQQQVPSLLRHTLAQHPYFACAPIVYRYQSNDRQAYQRALQAPWCRVAVLNRTHQVIGMVWAPGATADALPPVLRTPPTAANTFGKAWN